MQSEQHHASWLCATLGLAAFTLPALSGCAVESGPKAPEPDPVIVRLATEKQRLDSIRDVGNGVFVFPAVDSFPETLSDFREKRPELRVVSVTQGVDHNRSQRNYSWGRPAILSLSLKRSELDLRVVSGTATDSSNWN